MINFPHQRWLTSRGTVRATDIIYIPMAKGFEYLVAVMDCHSRRVLAWRLSNTLDVHFCVEALEEAIQHYGTPEIFNTDQDSQFTSEEFTGLLKQHGTKSAWPAKVVGWTMCLSNVYGAV